MGEAENRAIVLLFLDELFARDNVDRALSLLAPDFIDHHAPSSQPLGPEGVRQTYRRARQSFERIDVVVDEVIAAGDRVGVLATVRSRQIGDYAGVRATGRDITWRSMSIYRVEDGKIVERWGMSEIARRVREAQAAR